MPTIPYGENFNITATVISSRYDSNHVLIIPTGIIVFKEGSNGIGVAPLHGLGMGMASATLVVSSVTLGLGDHFITGYYPGDMNFLPAVSLPEEEDIISIGINTTATITKSLSGTLIYGTSIIFTATITQVTGSITPVGTVDFYDFFTTIIDTETLSSGNSISSIPLTLIVGTHLVNVGYLGNSQFLPSSSVQIPVVVNQAIPPIILSSNDNIQPTEAIYGDIITFTVIVSPVGSGIDPSGTATFYNSITPMGGALPLNGSGQASFSIGTLLVSGSPYPITANYSGDHNYESVTSNIVSQIIHKATPPITLISNDNPASTGDIITFTATVGSVGVGITPTGTVSFYDTITGPSILIGGPITLGAGAAALSISTLTNGTHQIIAVYSGDSNYNTVTSSILNEVITTRQHPTVTIVSNNNPSIYNQNVIFTITVSYAGPTPTGTVTLFDGLGVLVSGLVLSSGTITFSISTLSIGVYPIIAQYNGDSLYATTTSSILNQTVHKVTPTITLVSNFPTSYYTQNVTFTATVSPVGGLGIPTGTVTFSDSVIGIFGSNIPLNGSGQVSFSIATLTGGSHSITATYNGDSNYGTAMATISQYVNTIMPTIIISSSEPPPSGATYGDSITFTATVYPISPGVVPTGTVIFYDDITGSAVQISSTLTLTSGSTSFFISTLIAGMITHPIFAQYNGDINYSTAQSNTINQNIAQAMPSVNISLEDPNYPAIYGDNIGFNTTVNPVGGGVEPTGSVTYYNMGNGLPLGTLASLTSGSGIGFIGTLDVSGSPYNIIGVYNGDINYRSSSSNIVSQPVVAATPIVGMTASPSSSSSYGSNIQFTGNVFPVGLGVEPFGTLIFEDSSVAMSGSSTVTLSSGSAIFNIATLSGGTHSITGQYSGESGGDYNPATSPPLSYTVNPSTPTVTLTTSINPGFQNVPLTFTATVHPVGAGITPSGNIHFFADSSPIGTVNLNSSGVAQLVHTFTTIATSHIILAQYFCFGSSAGDYNGNNSNLLTQNINHG